jgi:hypothetical protein
MQMVAIIAVGLGATLVLDVWSLLLRGAFGLPITNYCLVGRWLLYMPGGIFRHAGIARAPVKRGECVVGWTIHYVIGAAYAWLLVLLSPRWLDDPKLWPALVLGIATVIMPFFVMQPAFGLGIASAKAPSPAQARWRSLMAHAVFGLGLYLSGVALRALS